MDSTVPGSADVGSRGTWSLPTDTGEMRVEGKFLGMASSHRDRHNQRTPHVDGFAQKGEPCSGCRWSVFRVFRDEIGYVIHYTGVSKVPGETLRYRNERVETAYEVVESMTTRRNKQAYLTVAAAKVLAQCAARDVPVRDAYENRAVG